mgnify:CR=1 FL=1
MTDEAPAPLRPIDPRVVATMRGYHAEAVAAGYDDHLFGALVIAAMVIVGLEDELAEARHPRGRGSAGV